MFGSTIPPSAALVAIGVAVLVTGSLLLALPPDILNPPFSVAFIGNSYLFLNDVPRLMGAISQGKIHQDSCLHPSASLASILTTGNGVYGRWHSKNAELKGNSSNVMYDYGSCTVVQLLNGTDPLLSYGNSNGAYYSDGNHPNPCFKSNSYMNYLKQKQGDVSWDYVVLVDMTKRMAFQNTRNKTLMALEEYYVPLLLASGATPIIVDTHAFWSSYTNMTGLGDIPTFSSLIHEGARQYVSLLRQNLPDDQQPIVAKIGIAYLTIFIESGDDMWPKLFYKDGVHSSLHGTFLFGCVLHCAIYGNAPSRTVTEHVQDLFSKARKLQGSDYPSQAEATYLLRIAERVMINGYVPNLDDYDNR